MLEEALSIYRTTFKTSRFLSELYAMVAAGVCAAETDAQAKVLRSSQELAFARLISGQPGKLPVPVQDVEALVPAPVLAQVRQALSCFATGSPSTVKAQLSAIIERYRPDELLVTGMIHDHAARVRSFEIVGDVLTQLIAQKRKTDPAGWHRHFWPILLKNSAMRKSPQKFGTLFRP
jgi:alkanesulfonate monooxygenase SsuD/methylene tetrahydromethanopterin reductase-like flavin-dependent oxidoreductase (luciferase family)